MMNTIKKSLQFIPYILNNSTRFNSFSSAISLKTLYPSSSLRLTHVSKPPESDNEFNGYIPLDKLDISYSRSSGPGGQNVNKVNTKVDVRFNVKSASWLNDNIKMKLLEKCKNQITKDGCLVFRSDLTRYQQMNLADCLAKIRALIRNSLEVQSVPTQETIDRIRKRQEKNNRERLALKRMRSQIKNERSQNIIVE
ncbi:peptidyl-tRNA hydrolase ICT1, mitochondrial [Coccinella septempunctata]|uniref:peptidyl-tRNA hydrolase ICT1, mitochondrial n=1 Tax=Coccinella septempunctata TaxID=41139 RepID=UPI001D06B97A|nr:peptidyl-tRNA hydrolase ICT1, mitochondrial [Coccinella septempunctata]